MRLALPIRLALREMRGGLAGFRVFLLCVTLGVAAIAAVGSVRSAIQQGLSDEAAILLGGDAEVSFTYRYADADERSWLDAKSQAVSEIVDFRSMAVFEDDTETETRALVQVKAIDALYPLYGNVVIKSNITLADGLAEQDALPGLLAEEVFVKRYGLEPGDLVRLGTQDFVLRGELSEIPDGAGTGFSYGPKVIVQRSALAQSGLLQEGTLFNATYRLKLNPTTDLAALKRDTLAQFADNGLQWRDRRNGAPGVSTFVNRLGSFLVLLGLAGLAVGGVGISSAIRSYLDAKTETIATFKTLGAQGRTIFLTYFTQVSLLALAGIVAGLILGTGLPLAVAPLIEARLPVPAQFGVYAGPLIEGAVYGALTALIFTFWPLARTQDIRAADLFREGTTDTRRIPRAAFVLATGLMVLALVGIAALLTDAPRLTLYMAGGVGAALVLLAIAGALLTRASQSLARAGLARRLPSLRWALVATGGPSGETRAVVLSLGLGLTVLAAIGQIDANLRGLVTRDLPQRAPSYFFLDIQNDQIDGFLEKGSAITGVEDIETAPMLRGILSRINDKPAREVAPGHWVTRGDRGLTYAASQPQNAKLTAGAWWPEDYDGPPLMSFAAEEATEMGLALGDEVTVNVLGRDITATIANFREVEFETLGINFVMILNPAALQNAPHTHIATVYADPEAEIPFLKSLSSAYPNITAIRVRDAIERAAEALNGISAATRWGASVTLLTGFIVLIGAAAAGERGRIFESAILKTLGARKGQILTSFALRAALTGFAAGLVALLGGMIAGWFVTTDIFDADYQFEPVSALLIVAGGALASLVAGLFFALRPLAARPTHVLRARE